MTFVRTRLSVVAKPLPKASVLIPTALPAWKGDEQENLLCGGCDAVIGKSISALTVKTTFAAPAQLIAICPKCRSNNVVSSTLIAER